MRRRSRLVKIPATGGGGGDGDYTPNLWVNPAGSDHSDSYTRAQILAAAGTKQWDTIGRAAWGSTSRGSPNASEAAQAGDVVEVAAGTYSTTGVDSRWGVAYLPANSGTVGSPIVFQTDGGVVTLTYSSGAGPMIGASQRDYVVWIGFSIDEANAPSVSDTGPVVLHRTTGSRISRCVIDGNGDPELNDNHNGIRCEHSSHCRIDQCTIHDVLTQASDNTWVTSSNNGSGIMFYSAHATTIEHCEIYYCGTGIDVKGEVDGENDNDGTIIRYNLIHHVGVAGIYFLSSTGTASTPNLVYQNIVRDGSGGSGGIGVLVKAVYDTCYTRIVNNVVDTCKIGIAMADSTQVFVTGHNLVWNNIVSHCTEYGIQSVPSGNVDEALVDWEHNIYHGNTVDCYDGTARTLAQWQATYPSQDQATPASITSDPLYTNEAGDVFTLQGGSPALTLGVDYLDLDGDSSTTDTVPAGAYITGSETIGVEA